MILSKRDVNRRWAATEILALWASYDPDVDPPVALWVSADGSQLCCDCASDREHMTGIEDTEEVEIFDPRIGCDDCNTVIAFD